MLLSEQKWEGSFRLTRVDDVTGFLGRINIVGEWFIACIVVANR